MNYFITVFHDTVKTIFTSEEYWISGLVLFGIWFFGYAVTCLVSLKSDVTSGKFYRLRFNVFADRYTLNGKWLERGQEIDVCFFEQNSAGVSYYCSRVYLKPTFFHWALFDAVTHVRIKTKISGLYACLPGEVPND